METPARLRLYQYPNSPFCIPIALLLRHSGIAHEIVDLPLYDPTEVIKLTEAKYYQVPVLEDLFSRQVVYERSVVGDEIPRYIQDLAPLLNLFPGEVDGLHRILLHYIENDCEAAGFKICDALCDHWLKSDVERGLHRRQKERKFGPGCLERWGHELNELIEEFYRRIQPFEQLLGRTPFLTGDRPVFADYALCGVIGNYLFPGNTSLPSNALMLEGWYTRMRAGNFRNPLDALALSADGSTTEAAPGDDLHADVQDVDRALTDLKLRRGTRALDVGCGAGHTAVHLAERGLNVTASDLSSVMLQETTRLASERGVSLELHEHSAEQLPYEDGTFGLVTCRAATHYFNAPEMFVREASRVLKTYGYLLIIDTAVPDDQVEASEWINAVEQLRDPSHARFHSPNVWRQWCVQAGLTVTRCTMEPRRMPDLNGYFNSAGTSPENRKEVLERVAKAPSAVRELFKIGQEDGRIIWTWRRMTLVAGKI